MSINKSIFFVMMCVCYDCGFVRTSTASFGKLAMRALFSVLKCVCVDFNCGAAAGSWGAVPVRDGHMSCKLLNTLY